MITSLIPPVSSTIAQLLYPPEQPFDFARIVGELDTVLTRLQTAAVTMAWDCDDLVLFDLGETRIALAANEFGPGEQAAGEAICLTVSVGPAGPHSAVASHHAVLCSRLVERIQNRTRPAAILWQEIAGPVDADVVDELIKALPNLPPTRPVADLVAADLVAVDLAKAGAAVAAMPAEADAAQDMATVDALPGPEAWTVLEVAASQVGYLPAVDSILDQMLHTDRNRRALPPLRALLGVPRRTAQTRPQNSGAHRLKASGWFMPVIVGKIERRLSRTAGFQPALVNADLHTVAKDTRNLADFSDLPQVSDLGPLSDLPGSPDLTNPANLKDETLAQLRTALYPPVARVEAPSIQIRLAAHCFNATLIVVCMPLGAAIMTYSLLNGDNIQLSSRMIAVAGTVVAIGHSPLWHSVRALAGV